MLSTHNLSEEWDGHGVARQAYKIVRGSVMAWNGLPVGIIVCQPIGVDKMSLKETQTVCEKIHQIYKIGG